jgi:Na+/proline symporter
MVMRSMRPSLHPVDWAILVAYAVFTVVLGLHFAKRAGKSVRTYFVGDRNLPWWVAGTSIVATTFAADTPLAITGIVATQGIAGNWLWWSWAIAHLTATFLFARMWRRSGVITDAEITELRYSGRAAAFLRGFKAVYVGVFINCLTMAWVIAAMVKISQAFFAVPAGDVIIVCVVVAVAYTVLGGFHSVVVTDLVQFVLGMVGAVALAIIVVGHFGGIGEADAGAPGLLGALATATESTGDAISDTLDFVPDADHPTMPLVAFLVLLGAGWWRYAEGNGYIVQRLAACRDEAHAQGASLWFAIAHNSLRPWPWILVGLASLIIYPRAPAPIPDVLESGAVRVQPAVLDVATGGTLTLTGVAAGDEVRVAEQRARVVQADDGTLTATFGPFRESTTTTVTVASGSALHQLDDLNITLTDREMAYPLLMGRFLPVGLLGLVIASLIAAFMSTIDTHANWGASYLVQDVYRRFIRPDASEDRCVAVSRLCVVAVAALAGALALVVQNIAEVWRFLVALGAGLGSVTAVRWYWSRVTPHAELAAIAVTTVLAVGLQLAFTPTLFGSHNPFFLVEIAGWRQILIIAFGSLYTWVIVALFGPRNDPETLRRFATAVRPPGPGWRGFRDGPELPVWPALVKVAAGAGVIYGSLFGIGHLLLGSGVTGVVWLAFAAALLYLVVRRA